MSFRATSFHEAGHTVVWGLQEEYLGPVGLVSALPHADSTGRVRGANGVLRPLTPRSLRAIGYMNAAGLIAERLAGFNTPELAAAKDARNLALLAYLSKRGSRFIDECLAGSELFLRGHWSSVERVAGYLRAAGELTGPHVEGLIRTVLDEPQRPVETDTDTLLRLWAAVENVPEFKDQLEAAARALAAA